MELSESNAMRRRVLVFLLICAVWTTGCGDGETGKAIGEFRQASGVLAGTYRMLLVSANTVEEEHYVDGLAIHPAPFDETAMLKLGLLTPEQITLRVSAIRALGAYTTLLATLASGEAAKALEPDAQVAGTSVATLVADLQAAVEKHQGDGGEKLAGPISAAVSAAGSVLKLIEQHRARKEVRESILANDPAIKDLYRMMEEESRIFYARQKQSLSDEQTAIVLAFDREAAQGAAGERMLAVSDRLKKVRREIALQAQANPKAAIVAFEDAHNALIDLIKNGSREKVTLLSLLASARRFAAEVEPLAGSVQAFVSSI